MVYDKEVVKQNITLNDVAWLLEELGAEPRVFSNYLTAITICHGGDSHKLYYYENSQLFKCYTGDCGTFDIFELVQKVEKIDLNAAISYVVNFFNLAVDEVDTDTLTEDWKILKKYNKLSEIKTNNNEKISLPEIDKDILQYYPQPRYANWEKENISKEVCDYMNIRYDPVNGGILIPHYDAEGRLIGIRERTLVQEQEQYGKYRPAIIQGKLRNHPLAFNLYGLNEAKENIKNLQVAMVFESEKAVLETMSYLGTKNNIAVAMCGSSLSNYQFHLLLDAGAKEIAIGLDKDFKKFGDEEYNLLVKKLEKLYDKYSSFCNVSFMFDKWNMLGYKDSPTDKGKDIFLYLWQHRIIL